MPTAILQKNVQDYVFAGKSKYPPIIETPSGIALLEIQGTININDRALTAGSVSDLSNGLDNFNPYLRRKIGKIDFSNHENGEIVMEVDEHQRLRGKITKLKQPLGLLKLNKDDDNTVGNDENAEIEIPIVEIITHKVVFATRPEPLIKI